VARAEASAVQPKTQAGTAAAGESPGAVGVSYEGRSRAAGGRANLRLFSRNPRALRAASTSLRQPARTRRPLGGWRKTGNRAGAQGGRPPFVILYIMGPCGASD
jgi:hypothetical protein